MTSKTLYNIIDSIHLKRVRLSTSPLAKVNNKPWTKDQQTKFYKLILDYGTDLNLIQSFFPSRTRNQIKKKYRDIYQTKGNAILRQENRIIRESRKSFFDQQILQQKLIKWRSKPNNSGASNSESDFDL